MQILIDAKANIEATDNNNNTTLITVPDRSYDSPKDLTDEVNALIRRCDRSLL